MRIGLLAASISVLSPLPKASAWDAPTCKTTTPGSGSNDVAGAEKAPTGFSDYESNGFVDDGEYAELHKNFNNPEGVDDGLGPFFNATSCGCCHHNPVAGGSSQVAVMRAGHLEFEHPGTPNGVLVFRDHPGGSLVHQRSTTGADYKKPEGKNHQLVPDIQKHITAADTSHTLRMSTNLLGLGFVECIGDADLVGHQQSQFKSPFGDLHGTVMVVLSTIDLKNSVQRIGRFGWKCQLASLLDFSADAYINEMGITNPIHPDENPAEDGRDVTKYDGKFDAATGKGEPNDDLQEKNDPVVHKFGKDTESFARFMRSTLAPPRDPELLKQANVQAGEQLFRNAAKTGCVICHVDSWTTVAAGTSLPGLLDKEGKLIPVPPALGSRIIHPYSDFLIHDIGTGDGIVQQQHAQFPPPGRKHVEPLSLERCGIHYGIDQWIGIVRTWRTPDGKDVKANGWLEKTREGGPCQALSGDLLETADKIRTAPLWGLRTRPQLLHDGSALTIDEAIRKHHGQAEPVTVNFYLNLSEKERQEMLAFLSSL